MSTWLARLILAVCLCCIPALAFAQNPRTSATYVRLKADLDAVPAIDTHDHLWPFDRLPGYRVTDRGRGMNLAGIWQNSYLGGINPVTKWQDGMAFDDWWKEAHDDFRNVRTTSVYRYQHEALRALYGVDFDRITADEARDLDHRIFENYRDQKWLYHVITERANIELMLNDPYWARYDFATHYPFEVIVFNITPLVRGFHASEFEQPADNPYEFAKKHGLPVDSLDDYLKVLDRLFIEAKDRGAVCLKSTLAYQRTLKFDNVSKERAEVAFGKRRTALTGDDIKAFEDYIFWRLCELSAKYELPFQIHTGHGRIQSSNPLLLVDLIEANLKTKFILFHGGFPWIGETGAIVMRHGHHVWIDSVWLPTLSEHLAKRAYHDWLDQIPSNRILWGADCNHAEGIYGATEFTRRCLAEVLAERVDRGDVTPEDAAIIGRQILRDNALELFPQLRERLWKHKGPLTPPEK
jgi:hypothetical protein